ncbi:transposase [Streptomyces diacarni]|uniref:Transposase n=1 Tax=Streptomyces diacarni TaxID=2800381 RepID=A0A367F5N8_9ACTN|nr:transposase [Streptomyces diacarni]
MPLTDARWARVEPPLPDRTPKSGGRRRDHREVLRVGAQHRVREFAQGVRAGSQAVVEIGGVGAAPLGGEAKASDGL